MGKAPAAPTLKGLKVTSDADAINSPWLSESNSCVTYRKPHNNNALFIQTVTSDADAINSPWLSESNSCVTYRKPHNNNALFIQTVTSDADAINSPWLSEHLANSCVTYRKLTTTMHCLNKQLRVMQTP
ncbi:hypothetical protein J6590_092442 [Homalodisca vitripennis]|nr:hypothetical protein J6590_092442 [Homalodisca vitripennis]